MNIRAIQSFTLQLRKEALLPYAGVAFALLAEAFEILLFVFAALITVEAFLPGFISLTGSFVKLAVLVFAVFIVLVALSQAIPVSFPFAPDKRSKVVWIGITWLAFVLTLSTVGFPTLAVPVIIGAVFAIGALFWKVLFRGE